MSAIVGAKQTPCCVLLFVVAAHGPDIVVSADEDPNDGVVSTSLNWAEPRAASSTIWRISLTSAQSCCELWPDDA